MGRKNSASNPPSHQWRFFRAGGFDQVRIDRGSDLAALGTLDQTLWVALACPISGIHFDTRTLQLIDSNSDNRIRAPELIAAVQWTVGLIINPDGLLRGSSTLPLSSVNVSSPEGAALLALMRRILAHRGKPDATELALDDIASFAGEFDKLPFNGDGIITRQSADTEDIKQGIHDIMACTGSRPDRSAQPGIGQEEIDRFFTEAKAFSDWAAQESGCALTAGTDTAKVAAAVDAVTAKVDDYFTRCRVAAFDERAAGALNRTEAEFAAMAGRELTVDTAEIAGLPLAHIQPGRALPLDRGINPAWENAVGRLYADAIVPLLGECNTLTAEGWARIRGMLAPYQAWQKAKAGAAAERLGIQRVRTLLTGSMRAALDDLMTKEKNAGEEAVSLGNVEKLVRFHRDLHRLCLNFVNFRDFYASESAAIFQAGTLFLDQRSCDLCLRVDDPARHSVMAALAGGYLAYCECVRAATGEKRQIVAAFTDGDSENLMNGRNGVFYDRDGNDWDATIIRIVDNPISLRQAFWSPYKNFVKLIEQMIARRAIAADADSNALLAQTAGTITAVSSQPPPPQKKVDVGTVAALGVAVGAIGTFFATVLGYLTGIVKLGPLGIIGAGVGIIGLISGPSLILAYIKLRKRNLGPILDANGWAINARARITVPLGASLTRVAKLPPGAQRDLADQFADKKSPWPKIIIAAIILYIAYMALDHMGFIYDWTKGRIGVKHAQVEQVNTGTPAATPSGMPK